MTSVAVAVRDENRAVIVATPNETAVTTPLDTVATLVVLEVHAASAVTSLFEPSL
jgi:hypothetical protein